MALLTVEQRKKKFAYLGLGEYNKDNTLKFQKKAFADESQWDSVYGKNTDNALRTFYNVKKNSKNFHPSEFRCNCGRCSGYPSYMKKLEIKHIQTIRYHYDRPMNITCGLRCPAENKAVGGVDNSGHLNGYAVDFNMKGVTDSVPNRNKSMAWIKKLPHHKLTYGAYMVGSDGVYRNAEGMGVALHTEVKP